MGPTKVKNEGKGLIKRQYEGNRPLKISLLHKCYRVPRDYVVLTLNPGLGQPMIKVNRIRDTCK